MTTLLAGVTARSSTSAADLDAIDAMTARLPYALHRIDLPWRISSTATHDSDNIRIWAAADGTPIAWAILQYPWHCLDYEIARGPYREALEEAILTWAADRLGVEATQRGADLPFFVSTRSDDSERLAAIRRAGFALADWSYVHMSRSLVQPIDNPALPDGFRIRSLRGESEVESYVATHRAAFGSTNMTVDWRQRTLRHRRYVPDLDLIAEASDGTMAAFCVGWLLVSDAGTVAQVEPLGVLPAFQRMGLGQAMLAEVFRRAQNLGARLIEVDAESYNSASRSLYESAGFREIITTPFGSRVFQPS
ncbi:MAG: GNAT family N-acetyltransferase [Thermomicrobiales bacterium]